MKGRSRLISGMMLVAALSFAEAAQAWELEVGRAQVDSTFDVDRATRVAFQDPFAVPPVVVPLTTSQGASSAILRVFNITTTGFDVVVTEPPGEDGPHVAQQFDYIAMEPGVHLLPTGETVAAGVLTTDLFVGFGGSGGTSGWDMASFGGALSGTPAVVAALQSFNSNPSAEPWNEPLSPFLSVAIGNVSSSGFAVAIDRVQSVSGTLASETIGWIAFPAGGGVFDDDADATISWRSVVGGAVRGWDNGCFSVAFGATLANPRAIASTNTRNGSDGGWLRRCSLSGSNVGLAVDEDTDLDSERAHTAERVGLLAFSGDFHVNFGLAEVSVSKSVEIEEDPINGATSPLAIPQSRLRYRIDFENAGGGPVDADSFVVVDALPVGVALRVVDLTDFTAGTGPVHFADIGPSSGLTFTVGALSDSSDDLAFSNDGGASFTYTPSPDGRGVDAAVTHIRLTPKGEFAAPQNGGAAPGFRFLYDVIVN
ncbi:MAG: hypothetical protein AAFR28_15325 [Pseudomonadota bacterium]